MFSLFVWVMCGYAGGFYLGCLVKFGLCSLLGHVWLLYGLCLGYCSAMFGLCLRYLRVVGHVWDMCGCCCVICVELGLGNV